MVGAAAWNTRRVCDLASSARRRDKGGSRCCLRFREGVRRRWSQALMVPREGMRGNGDKVQRGKLWFNIRSVIAHGSGAALGQDPERW